MQNQLQPSQGNLVERLTKQADEKPAVREAFLTVFSRPPADDELRRAVEFLSGEDS